ncbi:acyl-[acyl-carrier-protein] thioesterase [uncultured Lactobacillus sp.]|uniref:acyl-[acyl-carrier-protein] thioesterase n=1 Tax=uncultured Lactobacillus sp. TaxID=153152 RepID=UPI00261C0D49|nr:acyl-ACP thioesterase domain-containing protein [uncultured Lactobacillus sp.]
MAIYKQKHLITYSDADENGNLKLPALINFMMETSNHQLTDGGAGIGDFLKKGLGWVVVDYHFDIKRLPKAGEEITFTTNASGYNRFFEYRDFGAFDANDDQIIDVKSQWVILDLKKRKIVEANPELMQAFDNQELKKMPRFKRLRKINDYEDQKQYTVRYYDLDTNHHLTNSRYFDWIIDSLDREFLNSHKLTEIDITFKKEVKYGQTAQSKLKLDNDNLISYHLISHSEDTCALAELKWKDI